jgi:FAD/FMN-containing dehydrogenase
MRNLIADLAAVAGPEHVVTEPELVAGYATDWTRRYSGQASCVVRPASTDEVRGVIRICADHRIPLVPQGGNTGLVGGSVPPAADSAGTARLPIILSTSRLADLEPVDVVSASVIAGAGVTIGRLRAHAATAGLRYGVDLASRDSATVGGTIATNAGGIHAVRYGPTRSQLLGLTAVLADGRVIDTVRGATHVTAGYDLAQLLAGSEGTLAVITAARLRLRPVEPAAAVLLAGVAGITEAAELYSRIRAQVPGILAAEYVDAAGLELVCRVAGLPAPLQAPFGAYLLVELGEAANDPTAAFDVERLAAAGLPPESLVAIDRSGQSELWAYRERLTEAIASVGVPHKIDVGLPVGELGAFRAELDDVLSAVQGLRAVIVFGHIGVGNLHVNVLGPDPADTAVDEAVARLAAAHGGSVAAEHGIGRSKAGWLAWSSTPAEISAMRSIKTALDPMGLLNPGVLVQPSDDR